MEEQDEDRRLRIEGMMEGIRRALNGSELQDAQTALANAVAYICLLSTDSNPDRLFLNMIDSMLEVYRTMSNRQLRGNDRDFS